METLIITIFILLFLVMSIITQIYLTTSWEKGRQNTCEYWKMEIFSFKIWKFGFDCYILKYNPNTYLPRHKDKVENAKHWRLNIPLKGKSIFYHFNGKKVLYTKNLILFRPDIEAHWMAISETGCTRISFGFAKFN